MAKKSMVIRRQVAAVLLSTAMLTGPAGTGWVASATDNQQSAASTAVQTTESTPFSDTQGHWAERQIEKWAALGLASGSGGSFHPGNEISRAEFAKLVNVLFGFTTPSKESFSDVAEGKWYAAQIAIARQAGYISGYPSGEFKPESAVTRQEAAKMAAGLFQLPNSSKGTLSGFTDQKSIAGFAKGPLASLVDSGYMKGFNDGTLRPLQPITRAEAIVLLDRLAGEILNSPGTYENLNLGSNMLISSPNITVKGAEVPGSVMVTSGVGEGDVTLERATIKGTFFVNGGGSHSVHVNNSEVGSIVVKKSEGPVRIVLSGASKVGKLNIHSGALIEVGEQAAVTKLLVEEPAKGTDLNIKGNVGELSSASSNTRLNDKPIAAGGGFAVNGGTVTEHKGTETPPSAQPGGNGGGNGNSNGNSGGNGGSSGNGKTHTPPVLIPDAVDNVLHKDVKITFNDQLGWWQSVREVDLDGTKLIQGTEYTIAAGILTIKADVIKSVGDVSLVVKANGFKDAVLTQAIGEWKLVWGDEFSGDGSHVDTNGVNLDKWGYQEGNGSEYGVADWGNNEQEYYTKNNLQVQDGKLMITAKKQSMGGKPYTSGRLWTSPTFTKQYGKFEARIKMPEGQGLWPAFWMMPKDSAYGVWASSGEIDIMEARGRVKDSVDGTIHFGKQYPNNKSTGGTYHFPEGQSITGYHTYSVEWEPGEIRWYVDGNLYYKANEWSSIGAGQPDKYAFPAPFNKPFYLILNLAVGGKFDGNLLPPDSSLPAVMEVDYVRAYELEGKSYREPIEPVLVKEDIPSAARKPVDGNYIADVNFSKGLEDISQNDQALAADKWNFLHLPNYGGAGTAVVEPVDGTNYAKIMPTKGGNESFSLQMIQYAPLVKGRFYKLSFDAKATDNRSMAVKMGGDADNGWSAYSDSFDVPLKTGLKHYEYRFQMTNTTDIHARLEFNMGFNTNTIWIGKVRLEEMNQLSDPDSAKEPLEDDNHIYNGSFNLGTMDRMTYWHFVKKENADASAAVDPIQEKLHVAITDGGDTGEQIGLVQKGVNLLKGDRYRLTFEASSDSERSIGVRFVSKDSSVVYHNENDISLVTSLMEKSVAFTMPANISDTEGQLIFDLGGSGESVTLDNVRLIRETNLNVDYSGVDVFPLDNGNFASGLEGWEQFTQNSSAVYSAADGVAKVTVNNPGANPWDVMLNRPNMLLSAGIKYEVSFDAKASVARDIQATLENSQYTRWFDAGSIQLGTDWNRYTYTFKAAADDRVTLKMILGKTTKVAAGPHDVFFRNVVFQAHNAPLQRPQRLTLDKTDNRLGQVVELTFSDNAAWRSQISAVLVDRKPLEEGQFTMNQGRVVLQPDVFTTVGTHQIIIRAPGYGDAIVNQPMISSDGNLLVNGKFDYGTENWEHWVGTTGDSTFEIDDNKAARLDIHYYGGVTYEWGPPVPVSWYTQLTQSKVKLEGGKTYELAFRAWSDINRPILIETGGYNGDQKFAFDITDDSGALHTAVLKPGASLEMSLKFLLGNVVNGSSSTPNLEHTIWIDDVIVKEVKGGPQLIADSTDNKAGNDIVLSFVEEEAWRNAITVIKINGTAVSMDKVGIQSGTLSFDSSLFPNIGTYTISVIADGYVASEITQQVMTSSPNAAKGKTVIASSEAQPAAKAVDGITPKTGVAGTRWESIPNIDPQWFSVDLGKQYRIDTVMLNWEAAFAKVYKIQISTEAVPGENDWTDLYSETNSNGGIDTIVLQTPAEARHVRMWGTVRAIPYGYSLWEFEVYGVPVDGQGGEDPEQLAPPTMTADTSGNKAGSALELTFTANEAWENRITGISSDGRQLVKGTDFTVASGVITLKAGVFTEAGSYPLLVYAEGYEDAAVTQTVIAPDANIALHKTVTASSSNTNFDPNVITDGNNGTRWEANWNLHNEVEWVYVDLESIQDISRLVIKWEKAYASQALVQVADTLTGEETDWKTVESLDRNTVDADWTETVDLSGKAVKGQYVRLYMTSRHFSPYGPSMYELSVY
jgi:beta-glucanase (GH16 family)